MEYEDVEAKHEVQEDVEIEAEHEVQEELEIDLEDEFIMIIDEEESQSESESAYDIADMCYESDSDSDIVSNAEECQGKFAPSECPKTRVTEIKEKMKGEGEGEGEGITSNASRLAGRVGETDGGEDGGGNASSAKRF
ncbi:hypothetical protein G5I_09963 [Acromyrmex echinatior]|uniref:Uncharacterized protein n=1 Tax=Acromyrmex echinatior TaxID=103372 RepID=F4WVL9_ACREC|nr:hypothetical protein G5I_09963 [Acromyrmex echinatior]